MKNLMCSQCDYRCKAKGILNQHMRTHTGKKPYKCTKCSYEVGYSSVIAVRHSVRHSVRPDFMCRD